MVCCIGLAECTPLNHWLHSMSYISSPISIPDCFQMNQVNRILSKQPRRRVSSSSGRRYAHIVNRAESTLSVASEIGSQPFIISNRLEAINGVTKTWNSPLRKGARYHRNNPQFSSWTYEENHDRSFIVRDLLGKCIYVARLRVLTSKLWK